jgi:hypothetical protein
MRRFLRFIGISVESDEHSMTIDIAAPTASVLAVIAVVGVICIVHEALS